MVPPSQQLDISSMTVDDDYQGPRLEGGCRTCKASQRIAWCLACAQTRNCCVASPKQIAPHGQLHALVLLS